MRYLVRRVAQAVLVLALAYTVAYLLLAALPGDGVLARYGSPDLGLTPAQLDDIRAAYGTDRPLVVRFVESALGALRGDFGYSLHSGAAVGDLIAANLPATLLLAATALVVAVLLGTAIAFTATYGPWPWLRALVANLPPFFVSVPVFWAGIVLVQLFSFQLRLVPTIGASPLQSLVLPVATLAIPIAAPLAQVLMRSIEEVRAQPFVAVVRARGAGRAWELHRNVARNALLPTLTMAGLLFGELVGGAVVTETVFARNGLGRLTAQAVADRDTPVLLAVVVISTVAFVTINLIVDLLYPVLDPRLRRRGGGEGAKDAAGAAERAAEPVVAAPSAPAEPSAAPAPAASTTTSTPAAATKEAVS